MNTKCRLWWPKQLSSPPPPSSRERCSCLVLFGWFISRSPSSLDIVVAFAHHSCSLASDSPEFSALQVAVNHAHEAMPVRLQDNSILTVLGRCVVPSEDDLCELSMVNGKCEVSFQYPEASLQKHSSSESTSSGGCSCGRPKYVGLLQQYNNACFEGSTWIELVKDAEHCASSEICWLPSLNHLHWNGLTSSSVELHVMVYNSPRYGSHHFSVGSFGSKCIQYSPKKPKWVDELCDKPQIVDLVGYATRGDMVIVAINSSQGAKVSFDRKFGIQRSFNQPSLIHIFLNFSWMLFAAIVAALSTILYLVLQSFYKLARYGSKFIICDAFAAVFSNTLVTIQFRSQQILYWPIFLGENGLRSRACAEYAEIAGLRRHSFWSSAVVDIALGNLLGFSLFYHADAVYRLISNFAVQFTDDVLRTGCVWLMGVPAGFKLNTELAGVLGTISFNAIQVWCSLWMLAADVSYIFIKVVAFFGILLGATVSAALITDMIVVASLHVSALHKFVAFFYSLQIEALTALWRLFRGRKWNPLRQRLDSYENSMEQHVVGSLLFTPLLLLLPTTSVFYIYFATLNLTMIFIRIGVQIIISVIHQTPFAKVLLWLVSPERFPSGIWFEMVHYQNSIFASPASASKGFLPDSKPALLHLLVRSNISTFGQVIIPHYKNIFCGVHGPTLASAVSGILTGKSISVTRNQQLPLKLPWFSVSYKDYWCICYQAVLACFES